MPRASRPRIGGSAPCAGRRQAAHRSVRRVAASISTTSHHNTHSTAAGDEVAVLYAWHPWAGRLVRLHEVIERAVGAAARCSLVDAPLTRTQEIPVWMLDPVACRTMRATGEPVAALSALTRLRALLADAAHGAARQAPSRAALASPESRGDRHATSSAPAAPAARTRPDGWPCDADHSAGLGRPAGARAAHAEEPPEPPAYRAHLRRSGAGRPSRRRCR
jgi:hypothetical protein